MYGNFGPNEVIPSREPYGPELVVKCPTCGEKKGSTCTTRGGLETTGHPHNRRYIAAKMDPWATGEAA